MQAKKFILMIFFVSTIAFFISACKIFASPSNSDILPAVSPDPEEIMKASPASPTTRSTEALSLERPWSYRGLTPGISRKSDVLAQLGQPNTIRSYADYESLHYFLEQNRPAYILLKNGLVQAITSRDSGNRPLNADYPDALSRLTEMLGEPVQFETDLGSLVSVFPKNGIAISLSWYQYFVPTELRDYQNTWGTWGLEHDPFPLIPSLESAEIIPGQSTAERVGELLGAPDKIVVEKDRETWFYFLESDTWGQLEISFNTDHTVKTAAVDSLRKTINFETTVAQYGPPDTVQRLLDEEGQKYGSLALVYLSRGIRFAARCPDRACQGVRRSDRVEQKWYFEPTELPEYQAMFSQSDVAPWQGFDD
ncbi:MAG: hypothetical protein ACOYYS_26605 [Chloroflexota bacterium]